MKPISAYFILDTFANEKWHNHSTESDCHIVSLSLANQWFFPFGSPWGHHNCNFVYKVVAAHQSSLLVNLNQIFIYPIIIYPKSLSYRKVEFLDGAFQIMIYRNILWRTIAM